MNEKLEWATAAGVVIVVALLGAAALGIAATQHDVSTFWDAAAPAWVQAVGSLLAFGVAIAVPAYMRREELRVRRDENAGIAVVVMYALSEMLEHGRGAVTSTLQALEETAPSDVGALDPHTFTLLLSAFALPSEEQLIAVARANPTVAIHLARASSLVSQIRASVDMMTKVPRDPRMGELLVALTPFVREAAERLQAATNAWSDYFKDLPREVTGWHDRGAMQLGEK